MTAYGIDRFDTRYGLAAENVVKGRVWEAERAAASDRRRKLMTGIGNCHEPPVGSLAMLRSFAARLWDQRALDPGSTAVYVIGEENADHVKIGYAKDPFVRLKSLQTANHRNLYLHRLFWFNDLATARMAERSCHEMAEDDFERTEGEWFKCSAFDAHTVIERYADASCLDCLILTPILPD